MLCKELAQSSVAAGAAFAGAGGATNVAQRAQLERLNCLNDFGFRDLQTAAHDAFGAAVADFV